MKFLFLSGLSGAGKSQAVKVLEDSGYFCVDNLPLSIADKFLEICMSGTKFEKVALVIDIRGKLFLDNFRTFLEKLKIFEIKYSILFLEANDDVIVSRFKETRRKHPLGEEYGSIIEDIKKEKCMLDGIKQMADIIIDTSEITVRELREKILIAIDESESLRDIVINFSSFGYKYGIIKDADIIFDVRFLPNPFYVDTLKHKTGLDKKVESYVMMWPNSKKFIERFSDLISFTLPQYIKEGKSQLHIALGCTGGKHRSVVLAEYFSDWLKKNGYRVFVRHRDIEKTS
jgi:UPF0042 nucleotide-binding protein